MSVDDAIRGTEGEGKPPVTEGKSSEAIRTGPSRHGVASGVPAPASNRSADIPSATLPRKWITAIIVLALLVFGLTFALNYVGTGKTGGPVVVDGGDTAPAGQLKLSFRSTKFPGEKQPPLDAELHKTGQTDFWFKNENAQPVKVGLLDVNCKCSGISVYTLPKGSVQEPDNEANLEAKAKVVELKREEQTTVTVEPDQVGWVRLKWDGERQQGSDGATILRGTLWLNSQAGGPFPILETYVRFHEPMKMSRDDLSQPIRIEPRQASELPFSFVLESWSVTRSELAITAKLSGDRDPAKDLLVVGKPEPIKLTAKEAEAYATKHGETAVKAVYRIPVTIRDRPDTGAPFDAGPYRRRIEISLDDHAHASYVAEVVGSIKGDLLVLGQSDFRLNFTKFARTKGSQARILSIEGQKPGIVLEIDPDRTAKYLHVELTSKKVEDGKLPEWTLTARVKENEASGRFPRDDDPKYRDSAIYVRQKGVANARATRIAVEGDATD